MCEVLVWEGEQGEGVQLPSIKISFFKECVPAHKVVAAIPPFQEGSWMCWGRGGESGQSSSSPLSPQCPVPSQSAVGILWMERGQLRQIPAFDRCLAVGSTPKPTLTCKFLIMTDQARNYLFE